jgi:hypothetical protein
MALELFFVSARTNKRHHLLSAQAKRGALAISPAIVVLYSKRHHHHLESLGDIGMALLWAYCAFSFAERA